MAQARGAVVAASVASVCCFGEPPALVFAPGKSEHTSLPVVCRVLPHNYCLVCGIIRHRRHQPLATDAWTALLCPPLQVAAYEPVVCDTVSDDLQGVLEAHGWRPDAPTIWLACEMWRGRCTAGSSGSICGDALHGLGAASGVWQAVGSALGPLHSQALRCTGPPTPHMPPHTYQAPPVFARHASLPPTPFALCPLVWLQMRCSTILTRAP